MNIGEKLKQLRIKRNLTQEELANRCELSKGFISQIERNITSPSIATLVDILESLGTNLKYFFSDMDNNKVVFVKDEVSVQENAELGHRVNWIIPNAQKNNMEPILLRVHKNGRSSTYSPHEGEVFGYMMSGSLNLYLGGEKYRAKKGEAFYFKANASYYLENVSGSEASVLLVSTPPNF